MQAQEKSALYDRLGGIYSIATVIDDFIDRIMVDPSATFVKSASNKNREKTT